MPSEKTPPTVTAFVGDRCVASGSVTEAALKVQSHVQGMPDVQVLFFDDESGEVVDISLRGTAEELRSRLAERFPTTLSSNAVAQQAQSEATSRGRGRPKLGIISREVSLLPRHWEWLASQSGSPSAALRRLIDEARKTGTARDARRRAQKVTYLFISAMAGDRPYFEEVTKALFANDERSFVECMEPWPADIRRHAQRLAAEAFPGEAASSA